MQGVYAAIDTVAAKTTSQVATFIQPMLYLAHHTFERESRDV